MLLLSISLFMILLISIPIGGNNDTKSSSNSSSVENSNSSMKYCSKHSRSYNPDNAWKGCPDCVNEQDQKAMEKALEKARHL